jgi:hypothetical protein
LDAFSSVKDRIDVSVFILHALVFVPGALINILPETEKYSQNLKMDCNACTSNGAVLVLQRPRQPKFIRLASTPPLI